MDSWVKFALFIGLTMMTIGAVAFMLLPSEEEVPFNSTVGRQTFPEYGMPDLFPGIEDKESLKTFNATERSITIGTEVLKVAKVKPETPQNMYVIAGKDRLVAEFTISTYIDYDYKAWNGMEFYNLKTGLPLNRNYTLKMLDKIIEYDIPIYDNRCEVGSKDCFPEIVGYERKQRKTWKELTFKESLPKGNVTIGIFTDVEQGDYVEFIPTWFDIRMSEYASWTEVLNHNLVHYYTLDQGNGTAKDSIGWANGTLHPTDPFNVTGKLASAMQFSSSTDASINYTNTRTKAMNRNFSISMWVNITSNDDYGEILSSGLVSGGGWALTKRNVGTQYLIFTKPGVIEAGCQVPALPLNIWHHIALTVSQTGTETIYIDGVANCTSDISAVTFSSSSSYGRIGWGISGRLDELGIWNRTLTASEVDQLWNSGLGITYQSEFLSTSFTPEYIHPDNGKVFGVNNASFASNVTVIAGNLTNFTLFLWNSNGSVFNTTFLGVNGTYNQTNVTVYNFQHSLYYWNTLYCGYNSTGSRCTFNALNRTVAFDLLPPTISDQSGLSNILTLSIPVNSTWSYTATDISLGSCFYWTSDNATNTTVTCNSTITTQWFSQGNKSVFYCANDTFTRETCKNTNFSIALVNVTYSATPNPVGEGQNVVFNLSISYTGIGTYGATAQLNFNNTVYNGTVVYAGENLYRFSTTAFMADGFGISSGRGMNWNWTYIVTNVTNTTYLPDNTLTVYSMELDDCSSYTNQILNMTLKDEASQVPISSGNNSNIELDLTLTSRINQAVSWNYHNTWVDDADGFVKVCVPTNALNNSLYRIDITASYSATDHDTEFYYVDNGSVTNQFQYYDPYFNISPKGVNLNDLLTDDSTSFLFTFLDEDGLTVPEGIVHTYRKYIGDGEFREVERSKQDNNGETHVHLVQEDVIYYFKVSLNSRVLYTSDTYNAKCLSTPCSIELEASDTFVPASQNWTIINDGSYTITSNANTRSISMLFSLDDPHTMNLTIYKSNNNRVEAVASSATLATSGTITLTVPTSSGNTTFFASVFQDDSHIKSTWINFNTPGSYYFGTTGMIMGVLSLLTIIMMGVAEGVFIIPVFVFGIIVIGALKLLELDYYILVLIVAAGGLLTWRLIRRRQNG